VVLDGGCEEAEHVGSFLVSVDTTYSLVDGTVADAVFPAEVRELVTEEGGCRLLRKVFPFCDPACEPGTTCDHDGTCVPEPRNQDVGTVRIWGLEEWIELEPVQPGNRYFDTQVPHPVVLPGSEVRLDVDGPGFESLKLEGRGVELLEQPEGVALYIGAGEALSVEWVPVPLQEGAQVDLRVTVDQHGTSPLSLLCTFEDDGSAEVPAGLVAEFVAAGVSGFPNATIRRGTVDSAPSPDGCVDLRVASALEMPVGVEGHTPCTSDDDCPDGQHCDLAIETCVD